ncbi:MAG: hypothetical protein OEU92_27145, partial [Alphaproteobacteria bacterium]|nr:hypothetical protein [Alphaproteobacteria bacterium]
KTTILSTSRGTTKSANFRFQAEKANDFNGRVLKTQPRLFKISQAKHQPTEQGQETQDLKTNPKRVGEMRRAPAGALLIAPTDASLLRHVMEFCSAVDSLI